MAPLTKPRPPLKVGSTKRPAPFPSTDAHFPWRYTLGTWLHVRGFPPTRTGVVAAGRLINGFPFYVLRFPDNQELLIPQIKVSSKALPQPVAPKK